MKLELCAGTESAVRMAAELQFDRIELCQMLEIGGITPSIGFQQFSKELIETHVLIRPRGGGFQYSDHEKEIMLKDIVASRELGMDGVVVGALDEQGNLDKEWLQKVIAIKGSMELIFHRAFDEVKDWQQSMDVLIELGFKRILTAGQASNVSNGREILKNMREYANDRIEIMLGGGVEPTSIHEIKNLVKPHAIHLAGAKLIKLDENSRYATDALIPDLKLIQEILSEIKK